MEGLLIQAEVMLCAKAYNFAVCIVTKQNKQILILGVVVVKREKFQKIIKVQ